MTMHDLMPSNIRELIRNVAEALAALERAAGPNGRSHVALLMPDEERFALLGPPEGRMFIHTPHGQVVRFPLARLTVPRHSIVFIGPGDPCIDAVAEPALDSEDEFDERLAS